MTLKKSGEHYVFKCDSCEEELNTERDMFADALELMKAQDWRSKLDDFEDWSHFCGDC